jgi:hypothetical protein
MRLASGAVRSSAVFALSGVMRHWFASRPRMRSALAVLFALVTVGTLNAQGTRQSTIVIGDTVPAGTFRGTLVVREIADHRSEPLRKN